MNLADFERKLIAAARANPPSERVPYSFEKRIMAHLRAHPLPDECSQWAGALWRASVPCVAIMLLLSAWAFLGPPGAATGADLAQEFDNTVMAAVDQDSTADSAW